MQKEEQKEGHRLYVGNLSFDTTEEDLKAAFEPFGTVTDVKIMYERDSNRSRGFGFVTLSTKQEGEAAINGMNGKGLHQRNLTVNEARPREDRPRDERSGGGFRRTYNKGTERRHGGPHGSQHRHSSR